MRAYWPYILGFLLLLGLAVFIQSGSEKPVDWTPTYSQYDKIPYGTYILHDLLPKVFRKGPVEDNQLSAFLMTADSAYTGCNFIIPAHDFSPDEYDSRRLLQLADTGNNIFIMSSYIGGFLADTLKLETGDVYYTLKDTEEFNFAFVNSKSLPSQKFVFRNNRAASCFFNFDTSKTVVLGTLNDSNINFIKVKHGRGAFYIHCAPVAFTNYYLVDKKIRDYAFYCLSYLPDQRTIWNEYYLLGNPESSSPLRYIMANEPLRWAFWLLLGGVLFYIAFEIKRRQRIIPVITSEKNTTLEFADTLGRLYYEQGNHANIAGKKILYFYDFLRTRLFLRTDKMDDEFYKRFREKTGMSKEATATFFVNLKRLQHLEVVTEEELLDLNKSIDEFYSRVSGVKFDINDKKSDY